MCALASEPESINDVPLKRKSKQPKSKDQVNVKPNLAKSTLQFSGTIW